MSVILPTPFTHTDTGSALSLFMFGVFTDDPDHPFSLHNLALVADFLNRCPDFHSLLSSLPIPPSLPAGRRCEEGGGRGNSLFLPKNNSPPRKIIGGKFYRHLISRKDFDEVHSHLSGNMGQYLVAIFQFHPEHGIGKGFQDPPLHLDRILLRHSVSVCPLSGLCV